MVVIVGAGQKFTKSSKSPESRSSASENTCLEGNIGLEVLSEREQHFDGDGRTWWFFICERARCTSKEIKTIRARKGIAVANVPGPDTGDIIFDR